MRNKSNPWQLFISILGILLTIEIAVIGAIYKIYGVESDRQRATLIEVGKDVSSLKIHINVIGSEVKTLKKNNTNNQESIRNIRLKLDVLKDKIHLVEMKIKNSD